MGQRWRMRFLIVLCVGCGLMHVASHAQESKRVYTITGSVADAKTGETLAGATVIVRGTTLGASTQVDGGYSIFATLLPGQYRVSHKLIGYKEKTVDVTLGNDAIVDLGRVLVEEDVLQVQEVVVTGTGTAVEKERLGNAVSTISGSAIAGSSSQTVDAALVGKVAGALVQQNSGTPGGGVTVRLRGTSTISNAAEPLYIVDGIIVDNSSNELVNLGGYVGNRIADLDPNDIDHIEVVKGAAAAALYGSRANNGVIQIFTKRGQQSAPQITFRSQVGMSNIRKTYDVNTYEYRDPPTVANRPLVTRRDYQDDIFRTGVEYQNAISVSGGTDRTRYYLSASHGYDEGIVEATDNRKTSFRANIDQIINERLKVGVTTNYISSIGDRVPNGGIVGGEGVITNFTFQPNWFDLRPNAEGKYPTPPNAAFANELEVINRWKSPLYLNRFIGGMQLTATPWTGISLEYKLGYDQYTENANRQIPIGSSAGYTTGFSQQAIADYQLVNNDIVLSHTTSVPDVTFTTAAGFSHQYLGATVVTASVTSLSPIIVQLGAGANASALETREKRVIYGTFLQETVGLYDRLFLTAALRADAASTFSADDRWQLFPKASLSYVVSNEEFWRESIGHVVNRFKLRTAWGSSGGQPALSYARFSTYIQQGNSGRPGLVNSTTLGNKNLKPERMSEFEIGADFGLLNDRLSFEVSYYSKKLKDLLVPRTLPPSTGYTSVLDNVGELSNTGFELLAKALVFDDDAFQWVATMTLSTNTNKVTKLNGPAFAVANSFGISRVAEGEPLGFFYGTTYVRNADGTRAADSLGRPIRNPVNTKIGDPNPDLVASFLSDFQIGQKLNVHIQLDGTFGGDVFNFTRRILETPAFGNGKEYEKELRGEVSVGFFNARRTIFEEYIEDGSFIKLREVSVTYTFDGGVIGDLGLQNVQVRLTGRNLFSIDSYSGYDPEVNVASQSTLVRGFDWSTVPIPRTFLLGLVVNL